MRVRKIRACDGLYNAEQLIDRATQMQWHGASAEALGLQGSPRRPETLRVWNGRGPWMGEIAVARGPGGAHVSAFDIVIPAPAALRALWTAEAPSRRDVIEGVHARAVVTSIRHVEAVVPIMRRRDGDAVVRETAAGLVAARFRHAAAALGMCGDAGLDGSPAFHDHVVVANMALRSHESGMWCGIDGWELSRADVELSAVYHAEVLARLRDLGYTAQHAGGRLTVAGLASTVTARVATHEGHSTAARKTVVPSPRSGRTPRSGERVLSATGSAHLQIVAGEIARALGGVDGATSLTRSSALVSAGTLRRRVALASVGAVDGAEVAPVIARVGQSPLLSPVGATVWTTEHMLRQEAGVIAAARGLAARPPVPLGDDHIAAGLDDTRVALSPAQRRAAEHLATARFGLLMAPAGTGKTEVLRTVAAIRHHAGHRVFAVATAGETAQRLGHDLDAERAFTLEQFVQRARVSLDLAPSDVVIVDEAGLLETRRWWALLGAAVPASVIAAGDGRQLSPIEAGGMWDVLVAEIGAVTLTDNFRAREQWARDAWDAIRQGRGLVAIREYDRHGLVLIEDVRAEALRVAVDRWDADRRMHGDAPTLRQALLLTDRSNAAVDELNRLAQNRRLLTGDLSASGLVVETTQRGHHRRETLYCGDRVVLTRPVPRPGGRLENGTEATVVTKDAEAPTLELRIGDRAERLGGNDVTAVRLGYARHVYAAQSRTVDRVYTVLGGWQTRRETSYVAVSSARDRAIVVTDYASLGVTPGDREAAVRELGRRMSISGAKQAAVARSSAHDVVPLHPGRGRPPLYELYPDQQSIETGRSNGERLRAATAREAARVTAVHDAERGVERCGG